MLVAYRRTNQVFWWRRCNGFKVRCSGPLQPSWRSLRSPSSASDAGRADRCAPRVLRGARMLYRLQGTLYRCRAAMGGQGRGRGCRRRATGITLSPPLVCSKPRPPMTPMPAHPSRYGDRCASRSCGCSELASWIAQHSPTEGSPTQHPNADPTGRALASVSRISLLKGVVPLTGCAVLLRADDPDRCVGFALISVGVDVVRLQDSYPPL